VAIGGNAVGDLGYIPTEMTVLKAKDLNRQVDKVWGVLEKINDPELRVSLVGLGLIYKVGEEKGQIKIKMSLTSMGCPLFDVMESEIKEKVGKIDGVRGVKVELVWDPPWHSGLMSEVVKAELGVD
jgi:metal-sulfur cluster biosynthetic enzyme